MSDKTNQTAVAFWDEFMLYEDQIKQNLLGRTQEKFQKANNIVSNIKKILDIENGIGIHFGVDTRNGLVLPERKDTIELIISPILQRKNKKLVNDIYSLHGNYLSSDWSVIKYKFWQPSHLESMVLTYIDNGLSESDNKSDEQKLVEITKDDFSYYPIIDEKTHKVDIILFIADDKIKYLAKKETITLETQDREIYIPTNQGIYAMLDAAIGEFNLLNILDKMEIHLSSEHSEIEHKPLNDLTNLIKMVTNNPMSDIHACSRCNYTNAQTKLRVCKCKKKYYCDSVCQKACWKLHKKSCNQSSSGCSGGMSSDVNCDKV